MQLLLEPTGGGGENPSLVLQKRTDRFSGDPEIRTPCEQTLDLCVHHSVLQHRVNPIVGHALNVEVLPDSKEPSQRELGDEILTGKMWMGASGAPRRGEGRGKPPRGPHHMASRS